MLRPDLAFCKRAGSQGAASAVPGQRLADISIATGCCYRAPVHISAGTGCASYVYVDVDRWINATVARDEMPT